MKRQQVLGKIEQMMLEALEIAHRLWKQNSGNSLEGEWGTPPPGTLVKLYKDTHAAVMASIKQNIDSSAYYDNLSDEEALEQLETVRADLLKKLGNGALPNKKVFQ